MLRSAFNLPLSCLLLFLALHHLIEPSANQSVEPRIVGGKSAAIRRFPYQVAILSRGEFSCGGTIIRPGTILTAAHCVQKQKPRTLSIRAGSQYRNRGGVIRRVTGWRIHPKFNKRTLNYDVALMFLRRPLQFSNNIRSIPLNTQPLRGRAVVTATGYGTISERGQLSNSLRRTSFRVVPRSVCGRIYGQGLQRSMFCAGRLRGGRDTCQGDSGGPLTQNGVLVGITSNGAGCGRRGLPGFYVRIPFVRRWINRYV